MNSKIKYLGHVFSGNFIFKKRGLRVKFTSILLLSLIFYAPAFATTAPEEAWLEISAQLEKNYFDRQFIQEKWGALNKETLQKIQTASTPSKAYEEIEKALKAFGRSHLAYFPPWHSKAEAEHAQLREVSNQFYQRDFSIKKLGDDFYVTDVEPQGSSERQGLKNGFELVKIQSFVKEDWLRDDLPLMAMLQQVDRCFGGQVDLEGWVLPPRLEDLMSEKPVVITLKMPIYVGRFSAMGSLKVPRRVNCKCLGNRFGYVAFNAFTFDQVLEVKQWIATHQNTAGMIVDLRDNAGGVGQLACALAIEFCKRDYNMGEMKGTSMEMSFPVLAQTTRYQGPVVILVNEQSLSTSEILARGMQNAGEAMVIGQKTPGMALPSLIFNLKSGGKFQLPAADFHDAKGNVLEGVGVTPDISVAWTMADILAGTDSDLQAALTYFEKRELE